MFVVNMLMVGGWIVTLSMIGLCALHASGKPIGLRRRLALWLDASERRARVEHRVAGNTADARSRAALANRAD